MTKQLAIDILVNYNEWRRGADFPQPNPKLIGDAIDFAIKYLQDDSNYID